MDIERKVSIIDQSFEIVTLLISNLDVVNKAISHFFVALLSGLVDLFDFCDLGVSDDLDTADFASSTDVDFGNILKGLFGIDLSLFLNDSLGLLLGLRDDLFSDLGLLGSDLLDLIQFSLSVLLCQFLEA